MVKIQVTEDSITVSEINSKDPKERKFVAAAIKAWLEGVERRG